MKTLNVPDMHCPKCVARISDALGAVSIPFEISLENKTVCVDEAHVETTISELDDLGFDATVEA